MPGNKEHQEICVVGRLFSLEALLFLMGLVSFIYGLATGQWGNIIIGVLILAVMVILISVWRRFQFK
jgi:uncharacterized membrane protein YdbT with pleckstrin-like domain